MGAMPNINIDKYTIILVVIILGFLYYAITSRLPKGTPLNQFEYHAITFDDNSINIMPIIVVLGLILVVYVLTKRVSI